ncbi:hypothetical protein BDN70DRAFT_902044 [Pholiota conissans]|uniref:Uncharacterized protein n=1 Tax=Pholiota conissans TaxID=109636 RepID=A0A9P6CQT8_9AGAR|nr:hypothetical protein BDN70DRAFT_902044 [Pholiota conissans]
MNIDGGRTAKTGERQHTDNDNERTTTYGQRSMDNEQRTNNVTDDGQTAWTYATYGRCMDDNGRTTMYGRCAEDDVRMMGRVEGEEKGWWLRRWDDGRGAAMERRARRDVNDEETPTGQDLSWSCLLLFHLVSPLAALSSRHIKGGKTNNDDRVWVTMTVMYEGTMRGAQGIPSAGEEGKGSGAD